MIVQINPLVRGTVPRDAHAIRTRVNEICLNASLARELRAVALLQRLAEAADMPNGRYRELRVHRIHAEEDMARLDASSKPNAEPAFLAHLRGIGVAAADRFLAHHRADLGVRSTCALDAPDVPATPARADASPAWRCVSAARALGARPRALLARRMAPMSGAAPR